MKIHRLKPTVELLLLLGAIVCTTACLCCAAPPGHTADLHPFYQAVADGNDNQAISLGDSILSRLKSKYATCPAFSQLQARLTAAQFLADRMIRSLRQATQRKLQSVVADVLADTDARAAAPLPSITPARLFYQNARNLFARPIPSGPFDPNEQTFLRRYYDLKLRTLTTAIAAAGRALAVADPHFTGTHDYVLVLILLHSLGDRPLNTAMFPAWMRKPSHFEIFSDSCLLHFGLPFHAMELARKAAEMQARRFSVFEFYRNAADRCSKAHPHTAVGCLDRAIERLSPEMIDQRLDLSFRIVQILLDARDYVLAAARAAKIAQTYPDHKRTGRAKWLYYYALSRANKYDEILSTIENALDQPVCRPYRPSLMYIYWWALSRRAPQSPKLALVEHKLLSQYGNLPLVAPVLLSQATDYLARQDYTAAYERLSTLNEKFPQTRAAQQARKMLEKLKAAGP